MKQFIFGHHNGLAITNVLRAFWRLPLGLEDQITNFNQASIQMRAAGTFRNLRVRFNTDPPIGTNVSFTLERSTGGGASANTVLTVTVVGGGTGGPVVVENITDAVHVLVDDFVCWHPILIAPSPTWAGTILSCVVEFDSDVANECFYGTGSMAIGAGDKWFPIFHHSGRNPPTAPSDLAKDIMPIAGAITALSVQTCASPGVGGGAVPPGAGNSLSCTIYKNGVRQDGTAGTVNTTSTVSGGVQTNNTKTFVLPVVPGDRIWVDEIRSAGMAALFFRPAIKFVSATENLFPICSINDHDIAPPDQYFPPQETREGTSGLVEADAEIVGPVTPLTLDGAISALEIAPGAPTEEIDFIIRKNGADGTFRLDFAGTEVGPKLATGTAETFTSADLWNVRKTGAGTSPTSGGGQAVSFPGLTGAAPTTGTIIVTKVVEGGTAEVFPIVAGGGLLPTDFTLSDGESRQFDDVPSGSGYSITETVPSGWAVTYSVSNGSPHTNISVADGETVFVIITNRLISGCPAPTVAPVTGQNACPAPNPAVV